MSASKIKADWEHIMLGLKQNAMCNFISFCFFSFSFYHIQRPVLVPVFLREKTFPFVVENQESHLIQIHICPKALYSKCNYHSAGKSSVILLI